MTIKIAGYARMSTDKQQLSPEIQEEMIRDWFEYQSKSGRWPEGAEFVGMFIDRGVTTKIDLLDREAGQFIIPALDQGDYVVCAKYNRAFRSAADCERTLDRAKEAGIKFVFLDLNIDTGTANGRMMAGILAAVSRHERDLRGETTKEALNHLQRQGKPHGGPPWGWRIVTKDGEKTFVKDHMQRRIAYDCLKFIRMGMSLDRTFEALRKNHRRYGWKGPWQWKSLTLDKVYAMCCGAALGFPTCGLKSAKRVLGPEGVNLGAREFYLQDESAFETARALLDKGVAEGRHVKP